MIEEDVALVDQARPEGLGGELGAADREVGLGRRLHRHEVAHGRRLLGEPRPIIAALPVRPS